MINLHIAPFCFYYYTIKDGENRKRPTTIIFLIDTVVHNLTPVKLLTMKTLKYVLFSIENALKIDKDHFQIYSSLKCMLTLQYDCMFHLQRLCPPTYCFNILIIR